jgi:PAS domain S-box-containing protein
MNRNHRAFYQTLLDTLPDAFCVVDRNYNILFANNMSLSLLGFDNEESIIGRSLMDFLPEDEHKEVITHLNRDTKNQNQTTDIQILRKDGSLLPVEASSSSIRIDNEIRAYICIARDISFRKDIERKHQETAHRAMLYLDLLAHDISNQLQIMLSSTELLGAIHEDVKSHQLLTDLQASIQRCEDIIYRTTMIERLVTIPLKPLFICAGVQDIIADFTHHNPDVELHLSLSISDCQVKADEFLHMLVTAILENAIEHNPNPNKSIWIESYDDSFGCQISISDNGPGIPDGLKNVIFDQKQRPSGIGLQMCKMIMEKYCGSITILDRVEGKPEMGSKVQLLLPRYRE